MRLRLVRPLLMTVLFASSGVGPARWASSAEPAGRRMVLVELYTSQGCDMCPEAEKVLGAIAASNPRVVPIAFHVDYFNTPWKDVFSDSMYSQRQMTYDRIYVKPKPPEYGLYYTPMMMVDGAQTVNGRDPASASKAIREALARKPGVAIKVEVNAPADRSTGTAAVEVTSRSIRAEKTSLLVCAVLREDGVTTEIPSGENAGKTLVARFPARQTKYSFIELDDKTPKRQEYSFEIAPGWDRRKLRLAVFVQDKRTGMVLQSADVPWQKATPSAEKSAAVGK